MLPTLFKKSGLLKFFQRRTEPGYRYSLPAMPALPASQPSAAGGDLLALHDSIVRELLREDAGLQDVQDAAIRRMYAQQGCGGMIALYRLYTNSLQRLHAAESRARAAELNCSALQQSMEFVRLTGYQPAEQTAERRCEVRPA